MDRTLFRPKTLNLRPKLIFAGVLIVCLLTFFAFYTPQIGNIQRAGDIPLPDPIINGVKNIGRQPITEADRAQMSSIISAVHFDSHGYEVVDTSIDWERVQQAYDDKLRKMGFRPDTDVESDYISSWSRSRYFGMEGEQIVLIWENGNDVPQTYFIHLGIDR